MMRFDRFTERAQDAAHRAVEMLQRYGHTQVDTEHILLALLEQPEGVVGLILEKMAADPAVMAGKTEELLRASPRVNIYGGGQQGQMFITPRVKRIIDLANEEANRFKDEYISTEHIFLAIITERNTPAARMLAETGITRDRICDAIKEIRGGQRVTDPQAETRYRTLEKYSRDLTQAAKEGKLDPVIGRDKEILRVMQVLTRRTKNNPVLIGEAGVGKTAIVEGLAQKIASDDVPEILIGKRVVSLDLGAMVAGSRFRGEFEERLKAAIEEVQRSDGEIIMLIDELHNVVGAGAARARWTPATCSNPRWRAANCRRSAPPRWTNIASTSKKTPRWNAASRRSLSKNPELTTPSKCCGFCAIATRRTTKCALAKTPHRRGQAQRALCHRPPAAG